MVSEKNILFWNTYNRAKEKAEKYFTTIINYFEFGTPNVDINKRDTLLYILDYLEIIKESKYNYHHIKGLTTISNILNRL